MIGNNNENKKLKLFYTGYTDVGTEIARLTDEGKSVLCDFVILGIANTLDDLDDTFIAKDAEGTYDEADEEIYWGSENVAGHQLFPKETSIYIPVESTADISIRCSSKKSGASRRVVYSCFKYVDRRK